MSIIRILITCFFLVAVVMPSLSQVKDTHTVFNGKVTDLEGNPLPYTIIQVVSNKNLGDLVDSLGSFSIHTDSLLPSLKVYISNIAYKDTTVIIYPNKLNTVRLSEEIIVLNEVEIKANQLTEIVVGSKSNSFLANSDSSLVRMKVFSRGNGSGIMYKNGNEQKILKSALIYIYNPEKQALTYMVSLYTNDLKHKEYKNYDREMLHKLTKKIIIFKTNKSGWCEVMLNNYNIPLKPNNNLFLLVTDITSRKIYNHVFEILNIPLQISNEKNVFNFSTHAGNYIVYKKKKYKNAIVLKFLIE